METLIRKFEALIKEAKSFVSTNQILQSDLEAKNISLDEKIKESEKLSSDLKSKLDEVAKREKKCGRCDEVSQREFTAGEREDAATRLRAKLDLDISNHEKNMADEKSTLEAAQKRLSDSEKYLDKEKNEYRDKVRAELIAELTTNTIK